VSSEEKDRRKKAAEDKLRDLKEQGDNIDQFERGSRTTLEEQFKRTRDNIIADIRTTITAMAKNAGYTMVIDTAAQTVNATPVVLYCSPGDNDITEAVIKQINLGAPVDTPKSSDKPAVESPPKK
jgi:Skp family chaperone for outer membrane proteins